MKFTSLEEYHRLQLNRHTSRSKAAVKSFSSAIATTFGVHAARTVSPVPIMLARGLDPVEVKRAHAHPDDYGTIRVRSVRKTLHIYDLYDAAIAHSATKRYRIRDAETILAKLADRSDAKRISSAIHGALSDQHVRVDTLIKAVLQVPRLSRTTPQAIRSTLKLLWERGEIVLVNHGGRWDQERRLVRDAVRTGECARLNQYSEIEAEQLLIERYLEEYGPASLADMVWWSGLSQGRVQRALNSFEGVLVFYSEHFGEQLYALRENLEELLKFREVVPPAQCIFLGHEDPLLKAYKQTRSRYVSGQNYSHLFNQIGEALPAIVFQGAIVGTWQWVRSEQKISFTPFSSIETRVTMKLVSEHSVRLADQLKAAISCDSDCTLSKA
jgi:hypothetical protein